MFRSTCCSCASEREIIGLRTIKFKYKCATSQLSDLKSFIHCIGGMMLGYLCNGNFSSVVAVNIIGEKGHFSIQQPDIWLSWLLCSQSPHTVRSLVASFLRREQYYLHGTYSWVGEDQYWTSYYKCLQKLSPGCTEYIFA